MKMKNKRWCIYGVQKDEEIITSTQVARWFVKRLKHRKEQDDKNKSGKIKMLVHVDKNSN
jgi:hypothetical protein